MASWLSKLLLLLSVLLMPLAMAPASASASAPEHDGAEHSIMAMEHCPDQGSKPDLAPGIAACSMACAAALPAFTAVLGEQALPKGTPSNDFEPRKLAGLDPESADPPPRSA